MKVNSLVNHVSSCVYEMPRLLSLLVIVCMLIYDRCMIVVGFGVVGDRLGTV